MQVFKLCLKILKKNIPVMSVYIAVFLAVSLIMSSAMSGERQKEDSFTGTKSRVAFISGENTPLIGGLKHELGKFADFVDIPDKTEALQDALFFRSVSYILRIPEGFSESFMSGGDAQLEKTVVPGSYSSAYIDLAVDKYFNTARLYVKQMKNITQEELAGHLQSDLSAGAAVEMKTRPDGSKNTVYSNYFFNYLAYTMLSVFIMGMSALMLVFNDGDLKRRNNCSPLSSYSINLQFFLANLLFAFVSWVVMVAFCIMFNLKNSFNLNTVYFILNSFVFAICGSGVSFLAGNLVKSRSAIPAVCNVVTLALSFISGVFVPQELLGESVLKIAGFMPTYWYVRGNNRIAALARFDFSHVQPVLSDMLVQAGFAAAFFVVAMVIAKKKRYV